MKVIIEYVWLDNDYELRSKTRIVNPKEKWSINDIPIWNYDGSSTGQAETGQSEVVLKPQAIFKCPFRKSNGLLVLCDTYYNDDTPLTTNNRFDAHKIFESKLDEEPWFGIEQEFFIEFNEETEEIEKGIHYCGVCVGLDSKYRTLMEEFLQACLYSGVQLSGINAEVADGQWEYQIGPSEGIESGDHVWMSRYILLRVAEKHNATINFHPKPFKDSNGSGCHTNYSTKSMREDGGINIIKESIQKLGEKHNEHMEIYGIDNNLRMTGTNETASYDTFSCDIGSRESSIRIPHTTIKNKCGYFEDRRPGSNMDPYLVTSKIFDTTVLTT